MKILRYILIAAGVIYLISYFMNKENRDETMLNYAVLAVIGGLLAVVLNRTIADIFPMVTGVIIALNGALNLAGSIRNDTVPLYIKVLYVLMIVAGILIFFHPGAILNAVVFLIGAAFAVSGLVELLTAVKMQ